ncbi:MAG TPA: glucosaminidase domain-containing protein [Flavobacteriaceae bacterium]|nr:glucosaminidase domain-containing protein [Flavobacteriaceae bacterium]
MLKRSLLFVLLLSVSLVGCKSKKKATAKKRTTTHKVDRSHKPKETPKRPEVKGPTKTEETPQVSSDPIANYIDTYKQYAMDDMLQYGIPASIKLAQGILESGSGRGSLSIRANNHFGIKCHDWTGESVRHDDDELQECFRKYSHVKYSYRDHSLFLTQRSRYRPLFSLEKDDYKGWARGLRRAGYATDPKYPEKLINLIERYQLYRYDAMVLSGGQSDMSDRKTDKITTYTVQKGDTLYSIARRYNMTVDTLKEYNGLRSNEIQIGQKLYLHSVE